MPRDAPWSDKDCKTFPMRKKKMPQFRVRTRLNNQLPLTPSATLLSQRNTGLKSLDTPCTSLCNGGDQTELLLINPSHARRGLLTMRQGRWWCSSAPSPVLSAASTGTGRSCWTSWWRTGAKGPPNLHPLDFWPLPSEEKQVANKMMSGGTRKIL